MFSIKEKWLKKEVWLRKIMQFSIKKIKLESEIIKEEILKENPDFDIQNYELEKFLMIFNILISEIKEHDKNERLNDKDELNAEDGIKEILVLTGEEIFKFLQRDIDSLNLPHIIEKVPRTRENILDFVQIFKKYDQNQIKPRRERDNNQPIQQRHRPAGGVGVKKVQVKHRGSCKKFGRQT